MRRKLVMATLFVAMFAVLLLGAQPTQQAHAAAGTTGSITTKSSTVALNVAVAFELESLTAEADYGIFLDNSATKYINWTAASDETSRIVLITFDSTEVSSNSIIVSLTGGGATDLDEITLTVTETTDIISTAFLIGLFGVLFVLGVLVIIMKAVRKN